MNDYHLLTGEHKPQGTIASAPGVDKPGHKHALDHWKH